MSVDVAGGVGGGLLSLRGFGGTQDYVQTFSAVNATRTAEALNRVQRVPTEVIGFGAQWLQPLDRHALLVGAETRHIDGDDDRNAVHRAGAGAADHARRRHAAARHRASRRRRSTSAIG